MSDDVPDVAIACQGGGSHTAFTAGVLRRLLAEPDLEANLVGVSGTSGGAVCGLLAWYGRLHPGEDPGELLSSFWAELAADDPVDRLTNDAIQYGTALHRLGVPMPEVNPYHSPLSRLGQRALRRLLEDHVDFAAIPGLIDEDAPGLYVSAIDVRSGAFRIFREEDLAPEVILASAAEPRIFGAVEVDGEYYWDGLFSNNPPLKPFVTTTDRPDPDEIWLITINPQRRERVPRTNEGIADRRNELAGNLSTNAEIGFIEQLNEFVAAGYLPEEYTHTDVRRIRFRRKLDWRTKLDRSPELIERLVADGEDAAEAFLDRRD